MTDFYNGIFTSSELKELISEYGSIRNTVQHLNSQKGMPQIQIVSESGIRQFLKRHEQQKENNDTQEKKLDTRPVASGIINPPDTRRGNLAGKKFVFTAAQNNTFVHRGFFDSLRTFCEHNAATMVVSRFTYNKSGFQNSTKEDTEELWYDPCLLPYINDTSAQVAAGLLFCGELDILPTAGNPLSGLETYCFGNSGIIPHAKVAMRSIPRMKREDPRFLYTTGAVTLRNYIQRKAGQKADFHHVFGALYVEVDEAGTWFARQLIADNSGAFYDLSSYYTPLGISFNHEVMAVNLGDIHVEKTDDEVAAASWDSPDSLVKSLMPIYVFVHDLTDFSARNHHNLKDQYFLARMLRDNRDSVEDDFRESSSFLSKLQNTSLVAVVESNHHEAYERWLKEADIKYDPVNAEFFHESNARVFRAIRESDDDFDVYEWALKRNTELNNVIFLRADESFVICNDATAEEEGKIIGGIECGLHGHRGPNGARGTSNALKTIGRKCNLGHSHSTGIVDGVYTAGVSGKLDMDYNKGPSSWSHSHIITYNNGKRAIITIKNGKWKA